MRVAIVEDCLEQEEELRGFLARYGEENKVECVARHFPEAESFLEGYRSDYDVVLLDIELPQMNGMRAAERLREKDSDVVIVFVTNMTRYAVAGYGVSALDYIVKPINYFEFEKLMKKVCRVLDARRERDVVLKNSGSVQRISSSQIRYVEVYHHKLIFHMESGEMESWGSLKDVEAMVPREAFTRCNNSFLVNFKYVDAIEKEEVILGEDRLRISHLRKKDFVREFTRYLGKMR